MSARKPAAMEHVAGPSDSERLVDQLANRIGGLGVELADVAGNVQEVANRFVRPVASGSDICRQTAKTMVSANHDIANASQAVQSATSAAVGEITQSRAVVENAVKHIAELIEAVGRIETAAARRSDRRWRDVAKVSGRSRRSRSRPICSRSTPPSRRRAPARRDGALPWSRAR